MKETETKVTSVKPKHILSKEDYRNYRNVRAVGLWFVLLGFLLALGGIVLATDKPQDPQEQVPLAAALAVATAGVTAMAGGIGVRTGNRRWARLSYVMAAIYVLVIPLGTVLSYILCKGLSRYLESAERVKSAKASAV
jgi:uncharacterized membrane protein